MIPIIYEKDEAAFVSNGLGRLRDCISCTVTEERNGIYECDFEYPTTGANYDLIQVGRIIGVTHDDTGDIQPFDIVSYSKPIDNVVTFHCVHISYRQSYMTVKGTNINSLSSAFTLLGTAEPSNPFTYATDKTSNGFLACMDGTPRSVRETLGGIEGSILDAYGGEYEFDKWTVNLWSARGQYRNFTIRYGANMLTYDEDYDISDAYSSCIPYWTDGETFVVGDKQTSGYTTLTGRDECVPLDVSDKFETQPTKAQVESMGLSVMGNPALPTQNITISFARLQDMGYPELDNLLTCRLCDTITVVFPDYNGSGNFKIVKTVWNVLTGKYDEMELGDLSTTLSEALGLSNSLDRTGGSSPTPLPVVEEWTPNITPATGTLVSAKGYKYGNVYSLTVTIRKTTSTASGSNFFSGTLNNNVPTMMITGAGYIGSIPLGGSLNTNGTLNVRNASPSAYTFSSTASGAVTFTYIL